MHRSKGREFDNVYVLLNNPDIASDENKRKLYVAFTRASQSCVFITPVQLLTSTKTVLPIFPLMKKNTADLPI